VEQRPLRYEAIQIAVRIRGSTVHLSVPKPASEWKAHKEYALLNSATATRIVELTIERIRTGTPGEGPTYIGTLNQHQ